MNKPSVGDEIIMPCMGDDVYIAVSEVPEHQPHSEDEQFFIIDQYGAEHLVELDCDTWVTVNQ